MEELKEACLKGEVAKIKGFGKKTEEKILAAIKSLGTQPERLPYHYMLPIANWLEEELQNMTDIVRYSRAGSMRRLQETVKDLDYIIATNNVSFVKEQLHQLPKIKSITNDGETKISCVFEFEFDVQVDFRIVKPEQFATALHHFTGSKEHNVRMRQLAKARDEKISEYGVEKLTTGDVLTFESESDLYKHFGLPYIAPELREDGTEIDRIEKLEQLVSLQDIRGDLHMHTTWSDGAHSLEDMVLACREKGYNLWPLPIIRNFKSSQWFNT